MVVVVVMVLLLLLPPTSSPTLLQPLRRGSSPAPPLLPPTQPVHHREGHVEVAQQHAAELGDPHKVQAPPSIVSADPHFAASPPDDCRRMTCEKIDKR